MPRSWYSGLRLSSSPRRRLARLVQIDLDAAELLQLSTEPLGLVVARQELVENPPPDPRLGFPAAARMLGEHSPEGEIGQAVIPERAGGVGLELPEAEQRTRTHRMLGIVANDP